MLPILLIVVIGLAGGVAIGIQAPLSAIIGQKLGVVESVLIVHLGGAIAAALLLILLGDSKLAQWKSVPWYALGAGVLGVVVLGSTIYMVPRIGVGSAIVLIIAGQLIIGTTIDHFGALNVAAKEISLGRLAGLGMVFFGVWLTLRS